jgi:hypothetical protein
VTLLIAVVGPEATGMSIEISGGGTYGGGVSNSGGGGGGSLSSSGSSSIRRVSTGPSTTSTIFLPSPVARTHTNSTWMMTTSVKAAMRLLFLDGSSIEYE